MDLARELTLTLPSDVAKSIREIMDSRGYATEIEVIYAAMAALDRRDSRACP